MHFILLVFGVFNIFNTKRLVIANVLGCGGYIKSEVEINFAQVSIKLLTQQGNQKYETECAPNNGYYFIPLYDKGDYIIKVFPPSGWTFEPEEVSLKVDGETDSCSLNQDINFHFKGFAVVGRVVSVGSESGPVGITVILKQGNKEVLRTVTGDGGDYVFTPLASGNYDVFASHPTWKFLKDQVSVAVTDQNGNAGNSLVVNGYSVTGSVTMSEKISDKIVLVLHSHMKFTHKLGCTLGKPRGYESRLKEAVLCYTFANEGKFAFTSISTGRYIVVPHSLSIDKKYRIAPSELPVEVTHNDVQVTEQFKIEGCSMRGVVLMGHNSGVIIGAEVVLDENLRTLTDKDGKFFFENVLFGSHTVEISAEGVEFGKYKASLSLDDHDVKTYLPERYQTCFLVTVDSTTESNLPWMISIIGYASKHQVHTDASGRACLFLKSGGYSASVVLTVQDEEAGIRFGPKEHVFEVGSQPVSTMTFSQFLGEINGSISCLESCRVLTVSLRPARGSSIAPRSTASSQSKFLFKEVVPGDYLLSVDKEEWCWKEQTVTISVNAKSVSAKFEQNGFRLTLNASHRTTLTYMTNSGHSGTLEVARGTSRECVSSPGRYAFTAVGCHRFGNSPLTWDTASPQLLSLIATHHQVTGTLVSDEGGPYFITVKSDTGQEHNIGPLQALPTDRNIYTFEHWIAEGETVTLIPVSPSNLFQYTPPSYTFKMENDCVFSAVKFLADRALFLKGYIRPAVKGVTITVLGADELQTFTTNNKGFFIAGPLNKSQDYIVTAEKLGYSISPVSQRVDTTSQESEIIKMNFEAYKLAEIIVKITDENQNPLPGVLVSTSGGKDYRQNSLTESDGTISFLSLLPSDYFLRPMMKEYTFEPSSKMVTVESGATVNVSIRGSRVAYSIFGHTVSLNGEAEGDVIVEAVGIAPPCMDLQEEASSEAQGHFRIRGLVPKCDYKIRLKEGDTINQHVNKAIPAETVIKMEQSDYVGLKVIVMRPFLQMDVAVIVETEAQYLPSLTAELFRDDMPDIPVHVVPVGQHPFFMLPPMIADKQSYTLQLVSTLPHSHYTYSVPITSFTANSSFIRLTVPFRPTVKSIEAEISRGTVFGLILFMVLVTVGFNYNKIQPYVAKGIEFYAGSVGNSKSPPSASSLDTTSTFIEPVNTARKRVKLRKT